MKIKNFFKKKEDPLLIDKLSITYNIPLDLVNKILIQKKVKNHFWGDEEVPYSSDEYHLMLLGAMVTKQNQELIGVGLPPNDPRSIEINNFLISKGCSIQFHPHHGIMIVKNC